MNQSLALLISIVTVLILMRKIGIGIALFLGSVLLSLFVFGISGVEVVLRSMIEMSTLKVVAIVVLAFALGHTMEYFGMLRAIADELAESLGAFSFLVIPLLVGLLPMPGGALVSAVMLSPLLERYRLDAEKITFLNYWYRHIWVTVWPLYPSVIIGAAVLEISYASFAAATYPIALAAFLSGLIFVRGLEKKFSLNFTSLKNFIKNFYPIILLTVLAAVLKLDLLLSLVICLAVLLVHKNGVGRIVEIMRKTVDYRIIILVFAVMSYKGVIEHSGAAESLLTDVSASFPAPVAAFLLTFIIGFATGIEMSYSSIALPLLTSFTGVENVVAKNVMLVVAAGFVGVMFSPLHLCYVLTVEYFKADMAKSYRMLMFAATVVAVFTLLLYLII